MSSQRSFSPILEVLVPLRGNVLPLNAKVLGLRWSDRLALSAKKRGLKNIIFINQNQKAAGSFTDFFIISPNLFLSDAAWSKLARLELAPETLALLGEADACFAVRTDRGSFILEEMDRCSSVKELLNKISGRYAVVQVPVEKKDWFYLESEKGLSSLERWFLRGLIKQTEGFMSKHVERKISLFITRFLVRTRLTPNQMTLVSTFVGVAGGLLFISSNETYGIFGALLFWAHSVLDGCDGEIARLKFLESRRGGILDFWGDNLVHSVVFASIAYGAQGQSHSVVPTFLGVAAVTGTLLSAGWVYWFTMKNKEGAGPLFTSVVSEAAANGETASKNFKLKEELEDARRKTIQRAVDFLSRRDFIYLVILFSFFGKIEWFLWMSGIGAPLYCLVLLGLNARK